MTIQSTPTKSRRLVIINLLVEGPIESWNLTLGGIRFEIHEHRIGWNVDLAESIIVRLDGTVDGICLSGIQKEIGIGRHRIPHPIFLKFIRIARRSPLYVADDVRDVFSDWTIKRALKSYPRLFQDKKVLFHCASLSHAVNPILEAGASISGADPLVMTGAPVILSGQASLLLFFDGVKRTSHLILKKRPRHAMRLLSGLTWKALQRAMQNSDVFVTFSSMIGSLPDLSPLRGKVLVVDYLSAEEEQRVEAADPSLVIKLLPDHPSATAGNFRHFSVLAAVIDQMRLSEGNSVQFSEYLLNWFSQTGVAPKFPKKNNRALVRKCAFIVHALSEKDLWKTPGLGIFSSTPQLVRKNLARGLARLPAFPFGEVRGVKSDASGEQVECEIFALAATPATLLSANPEVVYKKLVQCVDLARNRGASIVGLGAYTKVIGDAGATVARRASLPVTNGNSYSAATTLWAARVAVEKMGFITSDREGQRLNAKAMVIGATGGIGRVSALLLSLVFKEVVLAANRIDKLLELQDEVKQFAPDVKVRITTMASVEARTSDLIVIATSNQSGSVLDIDEVKPGAVICDCSRPLDITAEQALRRPDVLVIESGEVLLPGSPEVTCDIGLPKPVVYACLAETVLLTLEGRFESFSLSKNLALDRVKEIYKMGLKHGAKLSVICGPLGVANDELIRKTRELALMRLPEWNARAATRAGLTTALASRSSSVRERETV